MTAAAGQGTVRVFIALDLPPSAKEQLAGVIATLRRAIPAGVRWVDPAGIHLTLKFLGNVDAGLVGPILEALQPGPVGFDRGPFPLHLEGLGVFPNQREPRVLWAGVGGAMPDLADLQQRVDASIATLGFARENRPFRPHLTLGRVRDGVEPAARREIGAVIAEQAGALSPDYAWRADEIHLIRSNLTPQGAIYTSLGAAPVS